MHGFFKFGKVSTFVRNIDSCFPFCYDNGDVYCVDCTSRCFLLTNGCYVCKHCGQFIKASVILDLNLKKYRYQLPLFGADISAQKGD